MNVDNAQLRCVATEISRYPRFNFTLMSWRGLLAVIALGIAGCGGSSAAPPSNPIAQFGKIKHVVFIIQENHTFDSIFGGPNGFPGADTASSGKMSDGTTVQFTQKSMGNQPGLENQFQDWLKSCDPDPKIKLQVGQPWPCRMDGFDQVRVNGGPPTAPYSYPPPAQVAPYFDIAHKYALADHFFASHNSESYTAHQFLFSGQAGGLPGTVDDPQPELDPTTSADRLLGSWNCSPAGVAVNQHLSQWSPSVLTPGAAEVPIPSLTTPPTEILTGPSPPCWSYPSLADLLNAQQTSWRVYAPFALFSVNSLASMKSIYNNPKYWPTGCVGLTCNNNDYFRSNLAQFLADDTSVSLPNYPTAPKYKTLAAVTWILASLNDSDHPLGITNPPSQGPAWVASIVDAIGTSPDWSSTAIFVLWDDWGGYYDHVPPYVVRDAAGVGFRVPLLIVSPYTKPGCILKTNTEFGTLLKFTEDTFKLGNLGANAVDQSPFIGNLDQCFDYTRARPFQSVTGAKDLLYWGPHFDGQPSTAQSQIRDD